MPAPAPITHNCPYCGGGMAITCMSCDTCHTRVEGPFPMSHLGKLPVEHQRFVEMFILCGGNLKELGEQVGVSYPTIRARLDKVIEALRREFTAPAAETRAESARLIKDI